MRRVGRLGFGGLAFVGALVALFGPTAVLSAEAPSSSTTPPVVKQSFHHLPSYPRTLAARGIEGTTVVLVHVLTDGTPAEVKIAQSSGHRQLDQAALDAVRQWRFEPGRRGDEAVATWLRVPLKFAAPRRCAERRSPKDIPLGATGVRAGIVTRVEGEASVRRVAAPGQARLKVDDELFLQDTVATAAGARVEMRFGCNRDLEAALGEQSTVTITETPGTSTLALQAGQIVFQVAPDVFPPEGSIVPPGVFANQRIQIATPNVMAVVRDAVRVTVETTPPTSSGSVGVSRVDVLAGSADVVISGITPRRLIRVKDNESLTVTGAVADPIRALAR